MAVHEQLEIVEAEGLEVFAFQADLERGACWDTYSKPGLYFGVMTEGHLETREDREPAMCWSPEDSTVFISRDGSMSAHRALASGRTSAIFVRLDLDKIEPLMGADMAGEIERCPTSGAPRPSSRNAQALAWQILSCRMRGPARRLYITARGLELLSYVLDERSDGERRSCGSTLSRAEIERLHAARAILLDSLSEPPTIPVLARRIGLNTRKLNEGFAGLFGTTVYAFVKERRLAQAKLLLESGDLNVSQVAYRMGYHPAHLSSEFRRTFGIPPSKIIPRRG